MCTRQKGPRKILQYVWHTSKAAEGAGRKEEEEDSRREREREKKVEDVEKKIENLQVNMDKKFNNLEESNLDVQTQLKRLQESMEILVSKI